MKTFWHGAKTSAQLPGGAPCGPRPSASGPSCPPQTPVRPCRRSDASSEASSSSGLPRPRLSDSGCSCPSPASPRWSPPSAPSSRSRRTSACTAESSFPIRPGPAAGPALVSDSWIHARPCPTTSGQSTFVPPSQYDFLSAALSVCLARLVLLWETVCAPNALCTHRQTEPASSVVMGFLLSPTQLSVKLFISKVTLQPEFSGFNAPSHITPALDRHAYQHSRTPDAHFCLFVCLWPNVQQQRRNRKL